MIALIAKMNRQVTIIPKVLLPIIPFLFLILVSYVIAKILEPTIRKKLNSILVAPVVRYYQSRLQLAKAPVRDDNN